MDDPSSKSRRRLPERSATDSARGVVGKPKESSGDRPVPLNQESGVPERMYGWMCTDFHSVLKPEETKTMESAEPEGKLGETEDYVPNFLTRGTKYYEALPEEFVSTPSSQETVPQPPSKYIRILPRNQPAIQTAQAPMYPSPSPWYLTPEGQWQRVHVHFVGQRPCLPRQKEIPKEKKAVYHPY